MQNKNKIKVAMEGSHYQNLNNKSINNKQGFTPHLLAGYKKNYLSTLKKGEGFTLVELLVVISIIGILSSLSTASVNVARERARDARRKSDMAQIQLALYLYFDDNLRFPETLNMEAQLGCDGDNCYWINTLTPHLNGSLVGKELYMKRVPVDPLDYNEFSYHYNSDGRKFVLSYYLEADGPKEFHGY